MLGLVLSGGGARGAYEAGVLRYLYDELGPRIGPEFAPDIVCGTSIGALTGAWIASTGREGAVKLADAWREMLPEHVYRLSPWDVWTFGKGPFWRETSLGAGHAIFDPQPLYDRMCGVLPWNELHARIDRGQLRAFVVATTEVMTGRCIQFVDGVGVEPRQTPTTRMIPARIAAEHCLASAALPLWFPSVRVDGRYYVDGSLRQNTPLLPAISLGADRILMVGVKQTLNQGVAQAPNAPPGLMFLAGKAFDALVLDDIEEDMRTVEQTNRLLEWGQSEYPDFLERVQAHRKLRPVDTAYVHPQHDLGKLAAECFVENKRTMPLTTRAFLSALHNREADDNSDLLSYVYFHKSFTAELEAMGFADAKRREERLAHLLMGGERAA